jgi:hypothetical protein
MEISKIKLPKKVTCANFKTSNKCESASHCIWNNAQCTQRKTSLFDEYIKIAHSKSGKYALEKIAKELHINYEGRTIKSICNDIQEILHVAMHGNTIKSISTKLNIDTQNLSDNNIYYIIYKYIFNKLAQSNHPLAPQELNKRIHILSTSHHVRHFVHEAPITPGYIDFTKNEVVYKNEYSFIKRIEYAKHINDILTKVTKNQYCDFKKGFEKIKRIGTKSRAGEAYIAYNGDSKLPIYVAIKLMPVKHLNLNEIENYRFFTNYVMNNISPHFPIMYKSAQCNSCQYDNKRHFQGPCLTVLNELAQGDLKSYLKSSHSSYDLICIFGQLIMTCLAMEHAGLVHNDMHWGNYLYHIVPEYKGKYMHYIFNDQVTHQPRNIYIKNNGIVFVGWDFADMAQPYEFSNENLHVDMYRILHIYKWVIEEGFPKFPSQAEKICAQLKDASRNNTYGVSGLLMYYNSLLHESNRSKRIQDVIFVDPITPPPSNKIINIKPYELPL